MKRIVLALLVLSVMAGLAGASAVASIVESGTGGEATVSLPSAAVVEMYPDEVWIPETPPDVWIPDVWIPEPPEVGTCEYPGHPPCTPVEIPDVWIMSQWYWFL